MTFIQSTWIMHFYVEIIAVLYIIYINVDTHKG